MGNLKEGQLRPSHEQNAGVNALMAAGISAYQAGDPAAAARWFRELLEQQPDDPDTLRLCGLALVRAGQPLDGLPLLARAVALSPRLALAHLHHGIGLLEAGSPARAAARFRRAATLEPGAPAPWINLSAALLAIGQPRAARAAARRALRISPNDADALHALGRGHAALGDLEAARAAFLASVGAAPGRVDAWIDLGLLHARTGEMHAAQRSMQRAVAVAPGHATASACLAAFAVVTGDAVESVFLLRAILARDPACMAARLNLANALLLDREIEESLALLSGPPPPGREGVYWRAHRALALLLAGRHAEAAQTLDAIAEPYGDAEILIVGHRMQLSRLGGDETAFEAFATQLEALIEDEKKSLFEHRVIAAFILARLRHEQGKRTEAFAQWRFGHRLMARVQPFSRAAFSAFVDAQIKTFDVAWLRAMRGEQADTAPVFIIGLPRSGTTLTEQILAAHPMVHGAGERKAVHEILSNLAAASLHPDAVKRLAALDEAALAATGKRFLKELHAEAPAARYVIDKMPANAFHAGFIATLLPGARFILCRRDLRDTGLSIFQHRFFGYHPYAHDLEDLGWFMAEHERLVGHWRDALPGRLTEVALEDWVGDFAKTLARLEAFLGLPHDPACVRFHESRRRVRTASAAQVRQPINARGLGRWRDYADELAPMIAQIVHSPHR